VPTIQDAVWLCCPDFSCRVQNHGSGRQWVGLLLWKPPSPALWLDLFWKTLT
jgi:hypothetical protein